MKEISIVSADNQIVPQAGEIFKPLHSITGKGLLPFNIFAIPWGHHKAILDRYDNEPMKALFYAAKTNDYYHTIMKHIIIVLLFFIGILAHAQHTVVVNPDGTHSIAINSGSTTTIVNPDGTHSTAINHGNTTTIVNPNGTHTNVINNGNTTTIINPDGTHSNFITDDSYTTYIYPNVITL